MKNMYGEIVKPRYEVAIMAHVSGSVDDDFESVDFYGANNYLEAVKIAKQQSLKYPDTKMNRVQINCYFEDDTSSYNEVWIEIYENGKKEGRYE